MHGDTQTHDICATMPGLYMHMATIPFVIPCLERKPLPVGTEPQQTPVPDRAAAAKYPLSSPLNSTEGQTRSRPRSRRYDRFTASHYLVACDWYVQSLPQHYH